MTCLATEFKCPNQNFCINEHYLCDGDNDCADGADELNCTCASDHYRCANGRCITNRWRCDGWNDCIDNSDETIELCSRLSCGQHAFRCRNKRCVPKASVCDDKDDCGDNSDESSCSSVNKCNSKQFKCERDQFCISKQFRCDGEANCVDDSDEINCKSPVCGFGACSQICLEKKKGYYNCRCDEGYTKGSEKNDTCEATGQPDLVLLIASDSEIRFLLPQKHEGTSIHGFVTVSTKKIDVFDTLITNSSIELYWIDSYNKQIQKLVMKTFNLKAKRTIRSMSEEAETIVSSIIVENEIK